MPFDYENYQRKRLLQHMKTCKAWMRKVGLEIRETARQYGFDAKAIEWLNRAGEIEGVADVYMQSWINELERIVYEKQNSGNGTECSGKRSNSVAENDGFRKIGIPDPGGDTQVQEEK